MAKVNWETVKEYEDITFKQCNGVARIAFNRPEVRNAFRPETVSELLEALIICHESQEIGVVLISGEGPSPKDGGWAFCSGGDQRVRSKRGYKGLDGVMKFNILDVQRQIRFMNKVVIAVVDRKSTRLNSSHVRISYAVFCLKKKKSTSRRRFV